MTEIGKTWSAPISRRALLEGVAYVGGVTTVLATVAVQPAQAKMAQKAVRYQASPKGGQQCSNCKLFTPPNGCTAVEGPIRPSGWCAIYVKA